MNAEELGKLRLGRVTTFIEPRGFGYIREIGTDKLTTHFFHITRCNVEPEVGTTVQYRLAEDAKTGRIMAVDVDRYDPSSSDVVAALSGRSAEIEPKETA